MGGAGVPGLQPIEGQESSGGLIKLLFLAFFSLSLLIMQQHLTEAVAGAFSRCLGFCGMRLRLLSRHWCIAGAFLLKVSSAVRCFRGGGAQAGSVGPRWVMLDPGWGQAGTGACHVLQ